MGYGKRVEPEDVVVQLTVRRRAWTTVADSSVAVRALARFLLGSAEHKHLIYPLLDGILSQNHEVGARNCAARLL